MLRSPRRNAQKIGLLEFIIFVVVIVVVVVWWVFLHPHHTSVLALSPSGYCVLVIVFRYDVMFKLRKSTVFLTLHFIWSKIPIYLPSFLFFFFFVLFFLGLCELASGKKIRKKKCVLFSSLHIQCYLGFSFLFFVFFGRIQCPKSEYHSLPFITFNGKTIHRFCVCNTAELNKVISSCFLFAAIVTAQILRNSVAVDLSEL